MKPGARAIIRNNKPSGTPIIEGTATLLSRHHVGHAADGETWRVRFDDDDADSRVRFVRFQDVEDAQAVENIRRESAREEIESVLADGYEAGGSMDWQRVQDALHKAWKALGGTGDLDEIAEQLANARAS